MQINPIYNCHFTGTETITASTRSKTAHNKRNESSNVAVLSEDSPSVSSGFIYSEIQKALIGNGVDKPYVVYNNGAQQAGKDVSSTTSTLTLGVPDGYSQNVFDYISKDLIKKRNERRVCPNSLSNVNFCFRNGKEEYLEPIDFQLIEEVDRGFEKIRGLDQGMTFYRALSGDDLKEHILNAEAGDVITPDRGYAQVTESEYMLSKYLPSESRNPVVFEIKCPKGSKVCMAPGEITGSGYPEAMMKGGAQYKVLSKEKTEYTWEYPDFFTGEIVAKSVPITKFVLELL